MFQTIALFVIAFTLSDCQPALECIHVNGTCGGVQQYKCCLGEQLQCVYETPIHPEAQGTCEKVCHVEGGICGGYSMDPQVCCTGFKCSQVDPRIPDLPGKCQKSTDHSSDLN
ncbi:unnamed protein product [Oppiella nova]|uniref:Uncharacterized protein n=1 Tax=Oppiella nova TaxID=334625 RepID=A0A7R9QVK7_9ACAR|nr:unnamed protein product [Oppiella nova]CAG2177220.1 unnamed protein product [Oppiella nova]